MRSEMVITPHFMIVFRSMAIIRMIGTVMPDKISVETLIELQVARRYQELGDKPPVFDLKCNDAEHHNRGAHTLSRHGPSIPLRRTSGEKTIEGRIHGDPPWPAPTTRSYQWIDLSSLNDTVNRYVHRNWTEIRAGLAIRSSHTAVADAGRPVGHGFDNLRSADDEPTARYRQVRQFKICLRLVADADVAIPFVLTAFPWSPQTSGRRKRTGQRCVGLPSARTAVTRSRPKADAGLRPPLLTSGSIGDSWTRGRPERTQPSPRPPPGGIFLWRPVTAARPRYRGHRRVVREPGQTPSSENERSMLDS
jgi:hypothetical protein